MEGAGWGWGGGWESGREGWRQRVGRLWGWGALPPGGGEATFSTGPRGTNLEGLEVCRGAPHFPCSLRPLIVFPTPSAVSRGGGPPLLRGLCVKNTSNLCTRMIPSTNTFRAQLGIDSSCGESQEPRPADDGLGAQGRLTHEPEAIALFPPPQPTPSETPPVFPGPFAVS